MRGLFFTACILLPLCAVAQLKLYLLPEVTLEKRAVLVSDILKVDGNSNNAIATIVIPEELYRDGIIDSSELRNMLSGLLSESFVIFGNGTRVLFKNTETIEPKSREFSPVFKKGDNVIIVVRKGDITIEMKGKALRDGFENEDAEVRVKSGKLIKGKISDGKVIVNL